MRRRQAIRAGSAQALGIGPGNERLPVMLTERFGQQVQVVQPDQPIAAGVRLAGYVVRIVAMGATMHAREQERVHGRYPQGIGRKGRQGHGFRTQLLVREQP